MVLMVTFKWGLQTLQWGLQSESSFVTEVPVNLRIFARTCNISPLLTPAPTVLYSSWCRSPPSPPGPQVHQGSQDPAVVGHQAAESSAGAACRGSPSAFSCPPSAPDQVSCIRFRYWCHVSRNRYQVSCVRHLVRYRWKPPGRLTRAH